MNEREIRSTRKTSYGAALYDVYINGQCTGAYLDLEAARLKVHNSIHGYPEESTIS